MIELHMSEDGVVLPIKAQPGARRSGIRGEHDGALRVSVTQVAEKGKANAAIVAVVAGQLGLRKSQIRLLSGQTSSRKKLLVRDVPLDDLTDRIQRALSQLQ